MISAFHLPEWIDHDGCGCPLPVGTRAMHRHKSGMICEQVISESDVRTDTWREGPFHVASSWCWAVNGRPDFGERTDIEAYKITGLPEEETIHIGQKEPEPA